MKPADAERALVGAWNWRRAVLTSDLPSTGKLVLLAVSCHANEMGGSAFPSVATIASETSLTRKTVKKRLREAHEAGWLRREERHTETGRQTSNLYRLTAPEREGGKSFPPPPHVPRGGGKEVPPSGGEGGSPPSIKAHKNGKGESRARTNGDLFEDEPDVVALAIAEFCERTGASWKLKAGINEWAREIQREPRYAGVDYRYEIRRCAEWHEAKDKSPAAPDRSIRNWLERAAADAQEKAKASDGGGPDWLDGLELGGGAP